MREADVEVILQRAQEKYPEAKPRIISDNARSHRSRLQGVHSYIERWHKSLKSECLRPGTPLSLEDVRRRHAQEDRTAARQKAEQVAANSGR